MIRNSTERLKSGRKRAKAVVSSDSGKQHTIFFGNVSGSSSASVIDTTDIKRPPSIENLDSLNSPTRTRRATESVSKKDEKKTQLKGQLQRQISVPNLPSWEVGTPISFEENQEISEEEKTVNDEDQVEKILEISRSRSTFSKQEYDLLNSVNLKFDMNRLTQSWRKSCRSTSSEQLLPDISQNSIMQEVSFEFSENNEKLVSSGTLEALLSLLFFPQVEEVDVSFVHQFLACFSSFSSPTRLWEEVVDRYDTIGKIEEKHLRLRASTDEEIFLEKHASIIFVLTQWLHVSFAHFANDQTLMEKFDVFCTNLSTKTVYERMCGQKLFEVKKGEIQNLIDLENLTLQIKPLLNSFPVCIGGETKKSFHGLEIMTTIQELKKTTKLTAMQISQLLLDDNLLVSSTSDKIFKDNQFYFIEKVFRRTTIHATRTLFDYNPAEVATQLTLIELKLYNQIHPVDLISKTWIKNDNSAVSKFLAHQNHISYTIIAEIVTTPNATKRVSTVTKMISLAQECVKIGNYNAALEVVIGLQHGAVIRLKKTLNALSSKSKKAFEELINLASPKDNYATYRKHIRENLKSGVPCLNWFGLLMKDLTFASDGNATYNSDGRINFNKARFLWELVTKQFKNCLKYQLDTKPINEIQNFLLSSGTLSDSELYSFSKFIETAGRDHGGSQLYPVRIDKAAISNAKLGKEQVDLQQRKKRRSFFRKSSSSHNLTNQSNGY